MPMLNAPAVQARMIRSGSVVARVSQSRDGGALVAGPQREHPPAPPRVVERGERAARSRASVVVAGVSHELTAGCERSRRSPQSVAGRVRSCHR